MENLSVLFGIALSADDDPSARTMACHALCACMEIFRPLLCGFSTAISEHQLNSIILDNRRLLDPRCPSPKYPPRPPPANRSRKWLAVDVHDAETNSRLASDCPMICIENKQSKRSKKQGRQTSTSTALPPNFFSRTLFGHAVVAMLVRVGVPTRSPQSTVHSPQQHNPQSRFGCYCLRE